MERGWDLLEKGRVVAAERKEEERKKAAAKRLRDWIETGNDPWAAHEDMLASTVMVIHPAMFGQAQKLLNSNQLGVNMHASVAYAPMTATCAVGP
jgi:hypothetical protein